MGQLPRLDTKTLPGPETVSRRELKNGITFLARENFASPSVVISGYLRVGSLQEESHMAGLASMTAASLIFSEGIQVTSSTLLRGYSEALSVSLSNP